MILIVVSKEKFLSFPPGSYIVLMDRINFIPFTEGHLVTIFAQLF